MRCGQIAAGPVRGQGGRQDRDLRGLSEGLDNKDIQAVLVSTPDHWHSPITMAACEAGKDVYVEKPVSNAIEPAQRMIEAARKYNRVVQVGMQQRSWQHFQDCVKIMRDGMLGTVGQCVMTYRGGGWGPTTPPPEKPGPPPADLDWEMFQGPGAAARLRAEPSEQLAQLLRLRRRDCNRLGRSPAGCHAVVHGRGSQDAPGDRRMGQYIGQIPDPERTPETFSIVWRFDNWVATFTNAVPPRTKIGTGQRPVRQLFLRHSRHAAGEPLRV